jgi:signal transduction histidine kinase
MLTVGEGRLQPIVPNMFDFGTIENSRGETLWASDITQNSFHNGGGFKNRISMGALELPAGTYKITFRTDIGHSFGSYNVSAPLDSIWYGIQVFQLDSNDHAYLDDQIKKELDNTYYPPFEIVNDVEFSEKYVRSAWIATNGTGLIKLNLNDNSYRRYTFEDEGPNLINSLNISVNVLEDKDGIVWASTQGGLVRFDPETETFNIIDQKYGLPSNQIAFMIQDLSGNLWFGTPGGISMLDKTNNDSLLSFINYDNTDGINSLPLNASVEITNEGEIFYGGIGGLNAFFPGSSNKTLPKPVLTNLMVSGKSADDIANEIGLETNISEAKSITLPFIYNNLSLEFASIHFSRPEKNKLAFMLEGIDEDWNFSNRRFASYSNLPPGDYEFKIRGANGDGIWNPEISSLKISITPPWWRTWWAYSLYGILVLFLLWQLHKFQKERTISIERQKTQQRELQQAKEIEKAYTELQATQSQLIQQEKLASLGQLTAGIAHEIKNPLNFVNNFSELSVELIEETKEELSTISDQLSAEDRKKVDEALVILHDIETNMKKIHEHGTRADSIVKSMLLHSRGTDGTKAPTDLNTVVKEYVNLSFHGMRASKDPINVGIDLHLDDSIGEVPLIVEDFSRVIVNLSNNAFDAMKDKLSAVSDQASASYKPKLTVRTLSEKGKVVVEIEDNGPGVPEEMKDKILQPFFTTKKGTAGTGLGLSITNDIIKAHGGSIEIESIPGQGSIFKIVLMRS